MVIAFASTALISIRSARLSLEKEMTRTLIDSVHSTSEAINASNSREFKMLETLAALPDIKDPEKDLLEKTRIIYSALSTDKDYIDVCILDDKGFAWINNGARKISFAERQYFQVPAKTGNRFLTDPYINKVTNQQALFYSVPVFDKSNNVINVIFCVVDGLRVSQISTSHMAGNNRPASIITLQNGKGGANECYSEIHAPGIIVASEKFLAGDAKKEEFATENLFTLAEETKDAEYINAIEDIKTKDSGCLTYKKAGQKYIMAYERIPETKWVVLNEIPYNDFREDINMMRNIIVICVVIMTIISVFIVGLAIAHAIKPLITVKTAIGEIATGNADLTKRITSTSKDEVGGVVDGFNMFTEKLQGIVSDIKQSETVLQTAGSDLNNSTQETASSIKQILMNISNVAGQIKTQVAGVHETAGAVNEIASNISSLEKMIESQSAGVSQASAAVEQMLGNITSVNQSVDKMADSFHRLEERALSGSEKQKDVNERIQQIESQSEMLQDANTAIATIAAQTNLLAMNAAIEAAHAGEAGKGFSVVADEIRKLSETSTTQSKTIGEQLNKIKESISEVVATSAESSEIFLSVSQQIQETDKLVQQIKEAMTEQQEGSKQIGESLHEMNDSTSEVKTASREMAAGNQAILEEVQSLQNATGQIQDSVLVMADSAMKIEKQGSNLEAITGKINTSIQQIGKQIDLFKV